MLWEMWWLKSLWGWMYNKSTWHIAINHGILVRIVLGHIIE